MKKVLIIGLVVICIAGLGYGGFWSYKKYFKKSAPGGTTTKNKLIDLGDGFYVQKTNSSYKVASGKTSGWFKTGQDADILLSGIDFNDAGGPLLFNHPGNVATDGKRLLLADRNNNRVLIWNKLPEGNEKPDLVLGQKDFNSNNPGTELDQLNWPVALAIDGNHVLVADTFNDRILIWNSFPTQNGQKADLYLGNPEGTRARSDEGTGLVGPWAVWTNGKKVIVTSTASARVFIWNEFPTQNNQKPDIVLNLKGDFGTPRSIGSDGEHLIIGDHNARGGSQGNFFWKSFPTQNNQKYDFFIPSVGQPQAAPPPKDSFNPIEHALAQAAPSNNQPPAGNPNQPSQPSGSPQIRPGEVFWGISFTPEGKIYLLSGSNQIAVWNKFPENENDAPDLLIGQSGGSNQKGYTFKGGDGSGTAIANGKIYISLANGNKIVVFNSLPTKSDQKPDFAIGSPDIDTNTLETEFIMSNPVPASNGESLFVSSDFDRKLYVYNQLPDESGAKPDIIYYLPEAPWDNELHNNTFALAGKSAVYIWKKLPTEIAKPDIIKDKIGSLALSEIKGVAFDNRYFYISSEQDDKIYVFEGLPEKNASPKFTLSVQKPGRLSSDGNYLVVTANAAPGGGDIYIFKVSDLDSNSQATSLKKSLKFNLPQYAVISDKKLFIGDTNFNRVLIWKNIEDALLGKSPDTLLGFTKLDTISEETKPQIGKDKLFWPAAPSYDGKYLWLGEFKFSERLLRFSPSP